MKSYVLEILTIITRLTPLIRELVNCLIINWLNIELLPGKMLNHKVATVIYGYPYLYGFMSMGFLNKMELGRLQIYQPRIYTKTNAGKIL